MSNMISFRSLGFALCFLDEFARVSSFTQRSENMHSFPLRARDHVLVLSCSNQFRR